MPKVKSAEETVQFWQRLEAERYDQSWKQPKFSHVKKEPKKVRSVDEQKERDRVMFHAGRFAEGARDVDALNANRLVGKYIYGSKK